ncbi:SIR2 family NAD-dependent protein deacylase [Actinoplanes sp. CA-142083]|uniref:SIR2 family NAD-dependent protein deacylase n=1 Tax=Actinoplanes sp. CA-142083 TaxID=3239903 RepID=UPI003D920B92
MPERDAADLLRDAKRVVVFTGAGMSAESGVPTFRDAQTGLWSRFDAKTLATPEAFARDPALVWGWYEWRRAAVERVRPNAGHQAVATIEARIPDTVVITQNVDDLHERAGSRGPIHLHGSLFAPRCSACAKPAPAPASSGAESSGAESSGAESSGAGSSEAESSGAGSSEAESSGAGSGGVGSGTPGSSAAQATDGPADAGEGDGRVKPPACAHCGAHVRPGVVWFGEQLSTNALSAATEAVFGCDLLFTIGTSGLVYPAAEIPYVAARSGAAVVQINPEPTSLDAVADVNLRGPAARILPDLVARAWGRP